MELLTKQTCSTGPTGQQCKEGKILEEKDRWLSPTKEIEKR